MRLIYVDKLKEDKTMCRKMKRTIIAMTCVIAMGVFNNDTFGCWSDDTNITRFRY